MEYELLHGYFNIDCVFVLELLKLNEVAVTNDLVWAMGKTEEKHWFPVFNTCVTHLELY